MARDTHDFKKISCAFGISFHDLRAFYARSFFEEQFRVPYAPHFCIYEYVLPLCDYCHSFDHDTDLRPQYI